MILSVHQFSFGRKKNQKDKFPISTCAPRVRTQEGTIYRREDSHEPHHFSRQSGMVIKLNRTTSNQNTPRSVPIHIVGSIVR